MDKEDLIDKFIDIFKVSFVDEFDKMDKGKDLVNAYLKEISVTYQYDYNTYCVDFLRVSRDRLNNMLLAEFYKIDALDFVKETLEVMVSEKIIIENKNNANKLAVTIINNMKKYLSENDKKE